MITIDNTLEPASISLTLRGLASANGLGRMRLRPGQWVAPPEEPPVDPPVDPPVSNTRLAQDVSATTLGQWNQIATGTITPDEGDTTLLALHQSQNQGLDLHTYFHEAFYDSVRQKILFIGVRVNVRFLIYDEVTDTWAEFNHIGMTNAPPASYANGHMYNRLTYDHENGHLYFLGGAITPERDSDTLYRYRVDDNAWEKWTGLYAQGFYAYTICWHGGMRKLLNLHHRELRSWDNGTIQLLKDGCGCLGTHSLAHYNPLTNEVWFVGGNYSYRNATMVAADGTITEKNNLPTDAWISGDKLFHDPVSGNNVLMSGRHLYEHDHAADSWHYIAGWPDDASYPLYQPATTGQYAVDLQNHKATLFLPKMTLYKHAAIRPPAVVQPLLVQQASAMTPGEWRNISNLTTWPGKDGGATFYEFQKVEYPGGASADGFGWTQNLGYHNGELFLVLMRDDMGKAIIHMDDEGNWSRTNNPTINYPGFYERRPFNRLFQDDQYYYFAPSDDNKYACGYFLRTPLDNPQVFEQVGPSWNDSQVDTAGNFAVTYVPEWGRFYGYTPAAKVWTRLPDDTSWTLIGQIPGFGAGPAPTGYAGIIVWNPVKEELCFVGGQYFGSGIDADYGSASGKITSPTGPIIANERMRNPSGVLMDMYASSSRILVHPVTGDYIVKPKTENKLYRHNEIGGTYSELYHDLDSNKPWGNFEPYAPFNVIPGTDVYVFVSHTEGVLLHRVKA